MILLPSQGLQFNIWISFLNLSFSWSTLPSPTSTNVISNFHQLNLQNRSPTQTFSFLFTVTALVPVTAVSQSDLCYSLLVKIPYTQYSLTLFFNFCDVQIWSQHRCNEILEEVSWSTGDGIHTVRFLKLSFRRSGCYWWWQHQGVAVNVGVREKLMELRRLANWKSSLLNEFPVILQAVKNGNKNRWRTWTSTSTWN